MSGQGVFGSVFLYALAKMAGDAAWQGAMERELELGTASEWPGVRTMGRLRAVEDKVTVWGSGATLVAKARSKASGLFLRSEADVWVTCDDDVECSAADVQKLVLAARATRAVVSAPCLLRGFKEAVANYALLEPTARTRVPLKEGQSATVLAVERTGFGLVALHRDAVMAVAERAKYVTKGLQPGEAPYRALFLEYVDAEGEWISDDISFNVRARQAGVSVHVLADVEVSHAGRVCKLGSFGELFEKGA